MQTHAQSDLLSIGEAALLLGISRDTIRRYEKAGRIASLRTPAGHRRFQRADLMALMTPGAAATA